PVVGRGSLHLRLLTGPSVDLVRPSPLRLTIRSSYDATMTALPAQPRHEIARIAYFSMEVALESGMPTYSGGLGVLAADLLRSAADAGLALVGVTLLHRRGYFRQHLD